MTSYQENTTKQPTECWILTTDRAKTHRHTDKRRNGFLKHKRVKHFLSNLNNNANETSASWWRHAWRWFPKNSYTKKITKLLLFSILRHNLSKNFRQTGLYCSKQLETTSRQFCERPLHITFKRWGLSIEACLTFYDYYSIKRGVKYLSPWLITSRLRFAVSRLNCPSGPCHSVLQLSLFFSLPSYNYGHPTE